MRFSIVVTAYNVEKYIAECVESLKRQTLSDFECIVIDDASTDETARVIAESIDRDSRFKAITLSQNSGPSVGRNIGMEHATGEFILFLDGDDFYSDDALERLDRELTANSLDMLYFAAQSFYASRKLRRTHYENQEIRASVLGVHSGVEMYVRMEETRAFRPSSCLYTVRRDLIEEHGLRYTEGILHEDLLFQMQLIPYPKRVAFLNEPLYQRRMREGSIMTTKPSMKNVHGLTVGAQLMENWLLAHVDEYPVQFVDAYAARIADTREVAARYLADIPKEDIAFYRATLQPKERIRFDMYVRCLWQSMKSVRDAYANSHAYRIGHALIAVPALIRKYVELPKAKPGE